MKYPAEGGEGLPCCNAEPRDKWKENNITNEISEPPFLWQAETIKAFLKHVKFIKSRGNISSPDINLEGFVLIIHH